jgi:hypothetical protein
VDCESVRRGQQAFPCHSSRDALNVSAGLMPAGGPGISSAPWRRAESHRPDSSPVYQQHQHDAEMD